MGLIHNPATAVFTPTIKLFFATLFLQTGFSDILLWVSTAVLVITSGLLVYSLLRLQRKTARNQGQEERVDKSNIWIDILWILIPVVILVLLLLLTFQAVSG